MDILWIALLIFVVNGLVFWLYYARTKRIIWRIRESDVDLFKQLLSKVEHRLAKPLPYYDDSKTETNVWAVVFTYQRADLVKRTLESLRRNEPTLKILVVDNGSDIDTQRELLGLHSGGAFNKLLLNRHEDVPQWQKGFAFHQAVNLLAVERPSHLFFLDDDVEVRKPFLQSALSILQELTHKRVGVLSLLTDEEQNKHHPTLERITVQGHEVQIKPTFNGAFFIASMETLNDLGMPPIAEGSNRWAAEDWYFSRRLMALDLRAGCLDMADHLGHGDSVRMRMESVV
jgi:hypothetical protein